MTDDKMMNLVRYGDQCDALIVINRMLTEFSLRADINDNARRFVDIASYAMNRGISSLDDRPLTEPEGLLDRVESDWLEAKV